VLDTQTLTGDDEIASVSTITATSVQDALSVPEPASTGLLALLSLWTLTFRNRTWIRSMQFDLGGENK
jgi:hypothetical protein